VFKADLSSPDGCGLIEGVVSRLGRIDIPVNMASVYTTSRSDLTSPTGMLSSMSTCAPFCRACRHSACGYSAAALSTSRLAAASVGRVPGFVPHYVAKAGGSTQRGTRSNSLLTTSVNAIAPGPIVAPPGTSADEYKAVEDSARSADGEEGDRQDGVALLESDFITGETIRCRWWAPSSLAAAPPTLGRGRAPAASGLLTSGTSTSKFSLLCLARPWPASNSARQARAAGRLLM
jgi:NAD(P)-dependent dehydrogenase (short-subunit alcohol dehydrogenase family)